MISYKLFYDTLFKKDITEYALIYKPGIHANTIHRLKQGKPLTNNTLDPICSILDCEVEAILQKIHPVAL